MKRLNRMRTQLPQASFIVVLLMLMISISSVSAAAETPPPVDPMGEQVTQGALRVKINDEVVECPLKHTDVKVNITGFIARVTVTQTFYNPYDEKIEAVYVFPLPHTAAVDAMTMKIGERTIVGVMKRRDEARAIYEQAIQQGQTASLLEQERPNIFTQSVGNIKPQDEIHIEISYVDVLNYDMGTYEFHFPMVVGPRYIPGDPISEKPPLPKALEGKVGVIKKNVTKVTLRDDPSGTGWSPDTDRVPDASRITPPVLKPGYRTGHDIRLAVSLDAGVPMQDIESVNHTAKLERIDASKARVEISPMDAVPNKDFVLKYKVVGEKPEMAVFAHATGPEQRYFMLMIQPKLHVQLAKAPPRELVFLVDVSGSMSGEPMAKVKAAMRHFFQLSKPDDTLQVITFSNRANKLFENPMPMTETNMARARTFTQQLYGSGGTEMLEGIKAVLNAPVDPKRVRIIVMLTDGHIGNEAKIIAEVGRRANDTIRFWTIGIGSSPNRFLIDGVAKQGGGMSGVLDLNTNPKPLVTQVVERIHHAQLADIQMDWKQLAVYETYPRRIPELWVGRPVILFGRYAAGGSTEIALSGTAEGEPLTYTLDVTLPDVDPTHDVLAKVWARKKIEDLSAQISDVHTPEVVEEITRIALDYRLMSEYTSFVAVDASEMSPISEQATPPRRVVVPVPLPEGVDFQGIFGQNEEPQFYYDLFGKELLEGNEVSNYPNYREQKAFDANGELVVGWTGQLDKGRFLVPQAQLRAGGQRRHFPGSYRGRYSGFAFGDASANLAPTHGRRNGNVADSGESGRVIDAARLLGFRAQASPVMDFEYVPQFNLPALEFFSRESVKRRAEAATAVAEAAALEKQGHLEAARLRYQHALGLQTGTDSADSTLLTTIEAIQSLTDEIAHKRIKVYPGLNRKLDAIVRNQPLVDAIRTVVEAGGFHLDLVQGSLKDVAALLRQTELRVTYHDLRHATVVQGLARLLAPYHLTWQMKDAETLTIGTARRLQGTSVWGYNIKEIALILTAKLDDNASREDVANVLNVFLQAIRTVIDQKDDSGIKPGSAVLLTPALLLVYGDPGIHEKVKQFLEALKDSDRDIGSIPDHEVSKEAREDLKALQKLVTGNWKRFAEAHEKAAAAKTHQRVIADMKTASLQLLAEALNGEIHLEALTKLQMAWEYPRLDTVAGAFLMSRSAFCVSTAAKVVPTDVELAAFSRKVLSKVRRMKILKPRDPSFADSLGTLYAVLALQNGEDAPDREIDRAITALMKKVEYLDEVRLITTAFLSPSEKVDTELEKAISEGRICDSDDHLLLSYLAAKRRGGRLWQTFHEKLPDIVHQHWVSGQVLVIISRLQALGIE